MNDNNTVLLTGGAGYIGSHTFLALVEAGYQPIILDDFSNSQTEVINRLERLAGRPVVCEMGDVLNSLFVTDTIQRYSCTAVLHFAGYKAVGESVRYPLKYYRNNVGGLVSLLHAMSDSDCRKLVFSSSAAVYGDAHTGPINEIAACTPESPYAQTKLTCEHILGALVATDRDWRVGILRYFNPVGAHSSGLIGEDPRGVPNNLMPYVAQVAVGRRAKLQIFGNDYATPDGTGVRDYLHVMDLAEGHVAALRELLSGGPGFKVNLGTGRGTSVLELVRAFELASGRPVPFDFVPRRAGDVPRYVADVSLANEVLGWQTSRTIHDMCVDSWRWQQANPEGYSMAIPGEAEPRYAQPKLSGGGRRLNGSHPVAPSLIR